jgi:hypothetical protein
MNPPRDALKHFGSLKRRNIRAAIAQRIAEQFPRIGGDRLTGLCADLVLEVVNEHLVPREHVASGQVRWLAIHRDCPPRRYPGSRPPRLVCVTLELSTPEDIERRIEGRPAPERLLQKVVRLCRQAHEQKALLSNSDLAELLNVSPSYIGTLLSAHERQSGKLVPRRATLHDVGTALTHKGIICRKRHLEGKEPDQIARETYHSLQAVDRYLGQFDRVRSCALLNMSPAQTAHILNCSLALVNQYLHLHQEFEERRRCATRT